MLKRSKLLCLLISVIFFVGAGVSVNPSGNGYFGHLGERVHAATLYNYNKYYVANYSLSWSLYNTSAFNSCGASEGNSGWYSNYLFNSNTGAIIGIGTNYGASPMFSTINPGSGAEIFGKGYYFFRYHINYGLSGGNYNVTSYTATITPITPTQGDFVSTVQAVNEEYPDNGLHTDGYWYVKGSMVNHSPISTIIKPSENETLSEACTNFTPSISVSDEENDTLTCKYFIDSETIPRDIKTVTDTTTAQSVAFTGFDVSMLSNGAHIIKFDVNDGAASSTLQVPITVGRLPLTSLTATPSAVSAELNIIDSNPDDTQYQITSGIRYLSQTGALTPVPTWIRLTGKKISVKGLAPNTDYTFEAKARSTGGIETGSVFTTFTTCRIPLPAPEGIFATPLSDTQIRITWKPVEDATGYFVEIDGDTENIAGIGTNLFFNHSGLSPDSIHKYRVCAIKDDAYGTWSTYVTAKTKMSIPYTPQITETAPSALAVKLSWTRVEKASAYEIEVDGEVKEVGSATAYNHTGLKPLTQHAYRIRAKNAAGVSNWSSLEVVSTTSGIPLIAPGPDIDSIEQKKTSTSVTLIWNPVADAEYYEIRDVTYSTDSKPVYNGPSTCCEIKELAPNTTYKFQVRARSSMDNADTPWSMAIPVTTFLLDTPVNVTADESDTSVKFTWDAVKDADKYETKLIKISLSGSPIEIFDSNEVNATQYTEANLDPDSKYTFSVMAKSSTMGESGWSKLITAKTLPLKPEIPQNVNAVVTDRMITIRWDDIKTAEAGSSSVDGYDIEIDGVLLENDLSTIYIYEELEPYTVYKYRVRSRNSGVEGDWSDMQEIRTLPGFPTAPEKINVKSAQSGATITWDAEAGASGYDIEISQLQAENDEKVIIEQVNNITKTGYTHRKLTPGAEYRYRIRTHNVQGTSNWSGYIINNAIKAECRKNSSVDLGLTATDVVDFSSYTMVVTYNPGVLEVTDLCTLSGKAELAPGKIEGTDITIKEFAPGRIVFMVDKAITPGEAWTGVINSIKFKAKATGGTTITYTVYTEAEE